MIPEHELRQMHWDEKMTTHNIAKEIGVSQRTVCYWMKKYGIDTRTCSESNLLNTPNPSENELVEMYYNQKMSACEIAKIFNVSEGTVYNQMKKHGIETRTISESLSGESHPNWMGGITFEPYCEKFNDIFREAVRERDNYICQLCGFEQNGRALDIHHIHYDKENCYPDVVALCRSCHSKVNGNRDYWEQYFEEQLLERGMLNWTVMEML